MEAAKIALSRDKTTALYFCDPPLDIDIPFSRGDFGNWVEEALDRVDTVLDDVLHTAGIEADRVSRVFATGGSSFVPAIRERLNQRFPNRLTGGDEMTSVALGLAERARSIFGA